MMLTGTGWMERPGMKRIKTMTKKGSDWKKGERRAANDPRQDTRQRRRGSEGSRKPPGFATGETGRAKGFDPKGRARPRASKRWGGWARVLGACADHIPRTRTCAYRDT